jgi:signal transduction histidine kinase
MRKLLWPAGVVLGLLAERASGFDAQAALDLATGWTLMACGLVAGGRAGLLLTAVGATWFAGNFAPDLLYLYRGPLVHLLVTYPSSRPASRLERAAVAGGYLAAVIPPIWASEPAAIALAAALVLVVAQGHAQAVGAARRARALSLAATAGVAAALAGGAAARLAFPAGDADDASLLVLELALCAAGGALGWGLRTRPWEHVELTDLVVELGEANSVSLRDQLARALGDPTLEVGYRVREGYVDVDGRPLSLPDPGSSRAVTFAERDAIALVHDPAVLDEAPLVQAVASSARMAASNAQLRSTVRAQVAELRASRRRIVAAGAEQRRALEQRLHDGAQRRLAELETLLDQARPSGLVDRAIGLLERADDDLTALARGLHPRDLGERGLAGALASLAEASPVPVELRVSDERWPAEIEGVAYFVCAEALANAVKHACASRVAIRAAREHGRLALEIADDGAGGAAFRPGGGLAGLADRVDAVGGVLRLDSPPGAGTRLVAAL